MGCRSKPKPQKKEKTSCCSSPYPSKCNAVLSHYLSPFCVPICVSPVCARQQFKPHCCKHNCKSRSKPHCPPHCEKDEGSMRNAFFNYMKKYRTDQSDGTKDMCEIALAGSKKWSEMTNAQKRKYNEQAPKDSPSSSLTTCTC